ncbi:hypothetical protein ACQ86B_28580 (plasmid) [Mycolicibacterium aichiense]|uniref:hypothetical protein n=1 Tax=Mycolicibacterium aichiense TaxID=1799 RepID=UPI003D6686E1
MAWRIKAFDEAIAVGFDGYSPAYHRRTGNLLDTSAPQVTVWLAGDVQSKLAGSEWLQWPIAGQHMLDPPHCGRPRGGGGAQHERCHCADR